MERAGTAVGVRELRARLSAYLRAVAAGATITIGDRRRRPVARLVPVTRSKDDAVLEKLAASGAVRLGAGHPGRGRRVKPRRGARPLSDVVIDNRG
jgi:prevent-host-death family protein